MVGYSLVEDDPAITDADLRAMCEGFAEEDRAAWRAYLRGLRVCQEMTGRWIICVRQDDGTHYHRGHEYDTRAQARSALRERKRDAAVADGRLTPTI